MLQNYTDLDAELDEDNGEDQGEEGEVDDDYAPMPDIIILGGVKNYATAMTKGWICQP